MPNAQSDGSKSDHSPGAPLLGGAPGNILDLSLSGLNALGTFWIFALMVLINMDAFGRTLFTAPIDGVNEMIELSLVGIVFLQLGDATRRGRLTRSDGFFNLMLTRSPRAGRIMGVTFELLSILFMVIVLYGSVPLLFESIEKDYYVGNEGVFTAPVWPVKLVIVIGCLVTLFQFLAFGIRYLRPGKE
ncbi:MAG: TRAP transporter small permease [Rhodospirillales bacterium]|nr:TRAP transporter small permease [Rhodospirillales bacterium]